MDAYTLFNMLKNEYKLFKYQPPIDLELILNFLNIKLKKIFEWNDILGEIKKTEKETIITINEAYHLFEYEERYTIVHEIGHYIKHIINNKSNDKIVFKDNEKNLLLRPIFSINEYQANSFAYHLLIPNDLLFKFGEEIANSLKINKHSNKDYINIFITKMAKKFNVSKIIMKNKLYLLGII